MILFSYYYIALLLLFNFIIIHYYSLLLFNFIIIHYLF